MKLNPAKIFYKRLKSAVFSGNTAAYLGLMLKFVSPFTKVLDAIIGDKPKNNECPPCVMMVGPSRTGATIIYQVISRAIPCVYVSNLHALFPRYASKYLFKKELYGKSSLNFNNYYGYTSQLNDVYEGNELVAKIFKGNPSKEVVRKRFLQFVNSLGATEEKPLIFKNVRYYDKIYQLHKAVPELTFLRVKRNTFNLAQSVLNAYYELGYFHPIPDSLKEKNIIDPIEFSVLQVLEVEKIIDGQLAKMPSEKVLRWNYEDFCKNPWEMIEGLAKNYLKIDKSLLRRNVLSQPLKASNKIKVGEEIEEKIKKMIEKHSNQA